MRNGIYVASRVRHAAMWRTARESGFPIISTWIDEAEQVEPESMSDLWQRCITEARDADALVFYREGDEPLKGALVEVGAALAAGKQVIAVGFDGAESMSQFSFLNHPNVFRSLFIESALILAKRYTEEAPHA